MNQEDPLLARLHSLPLSEPNEQLSQRIALMAHAQLRAKRVHPIWTFVVAASVVSYLGWALMFTSKLY
ncbi:MAG TPA: hypothetical protein VL137_11205 [Polyangiaceae bacterium]|nr:hypothetical protein [Polyangiaceae bacterium]